MRLMPSCEQNQQIVALQFWLSLETVPPLKWLWSYLQHYPGLTRLGTLFHPLRGVGSIQRYPAHDFLSEPFGG
jgi:hypothetical protein